MSALMPLRYPLGVLLACFLAFAGPSGEHRSAPTGARAARPVRLLGSALRDRADAADRDGVRPGRPAVRRAGDRPDRRRGRRQREAARARARVPRAARARLERPTPLRLVARAPGQPEPRRQDAARAAHAAQGAAERPPPAGQRRRRRRRAPLPRLGIDVRRLQGEGREERHDPLRPPERPRPAHRREGPAQPVRARGPTGNRSPVRDRERARRSRRGTGRDARPGHAGPQLRLAGLLAELEAEAARRQRAARGSLPRLRTSSRTPLRAGSRSLRDGRTAYVALWGTYFGRKHGRTVVRLTFDAAGRVTRQVVFARGFDHPLAVLVARDGALLVSDWGTGRIYRIAR